MYALLLVAALSITAEGLNEHLSWTDLFNNSLFVYLCAGCNYGAVRLEDGDTQFEGRVELCVNSSWHTVCDNGWGSPDARVVCSQLGYSYSGCKYCIYIVKIDRFQTITV